MSNVFAVFETFEIFSNIKNLGPLPSGVSLGFPLMDYLTPRCLSSYTFTDDDIAYLLGFEGVYTTEGVPSDWSYEPSED